MKQSETMLIQLKNGIQHIVFRKFLDFYFTLLREILFDEF